MKHKAFTLVEMLCVVAIIAILAACWFIDSWEGEMALQGIATGANLWQFTVDWREFRPNTIEDIKKAMRSGKRVELLYKQTLFRNPFTRDTCYLIRKVNFLDENGNVIPESIEAPEATKAPEDGQ
jgi:prepilin-type N-terminal cleavage/methylation domain-containing protein